MKLLLTWVVAVGVLGCDGGKPKGPLQGVYASVEELLQAAEARVDALCECTDQPCRVRVMSAPDNPLGAAATPARARFTAAQRVQYGELLKKSVMCTTTP